MHQLHPVHQTCGLQNVKFSHQCQQLHKMKRALPLNGLKHVLQNGVLQCWTKLRGFLSVSKFPSSTPHHCFFDTGSDLLKGLFNSESWARIIYQGRATISMWLSCLHWNHSTLLHLQSHPEPVMKIASLPNLGIFVIFRKRVFCRPCRLPTASKVSVARTPPPSPLSSPKRLISQPIICNPKPQSRSIAHDVMLIKMMQEKKYQEMQRNEYV